MSETEPNEAPTPDEPSGDEGEDYGAKGADAPDEPASQPEQAPVPEAD